MIKIRSMSSTKQFPITRITQIICKKVRKRDMHIPQKRNVMIRLRIFVQVHNFSNMTKKKKEWNLDRELFHLLIDF